MTSSVLVAPSLLSADPLRLAEELSDVEQKGADWHHVDVMDGHFVPNLTYGPPLVRALKKFSKIPLDVHIMVSNPEDVAFDYVDAGADVLSFHIEAATHGHRLVSALKARGVKAGVAINPGTAIESLWPLLPEVDLVLIMSVNPGFGGQKFITDASSRVNAVDERLKILGRRSEVRIEVDGGINEETGAAVVKAGADVLVAGSYIYNTQDRENRITSLKEIR